MHDDLIEYVQKNFPDFWSDIHIRFELGEPFDNGTDERIEQVVARVHTLFEEVFAPDDIIHLYIQDWGDEPDVMFGNTTPCYLYKLLSRHTFEEQAMFQQDKDIDDAGHTIPVSIPYKTTTLSGRLSSLPYREILSGIANYEQGREPSIGQRVYFIDMNRDIMFHMYDDRGCIIFAKEKKRLQSLYARYNDWLADHWRPYFDELYR